MTPAMAVAEAAGEDWAPPMGTDPEDPGRPAGAGEAWEASDDPATDAPHGDGLPPGEPWDSLRREPLRAMGFVTVAPEHQTAPTRDRPSPGWRCRSDIAHEPGEWYYRGAELRYRCPKHGDWDFLTFFAARFGFRPREIADKAAQTLAAVYGTCMGIGIPDDPGADPVPAVAPVEQQTTKRKWPAPMAQEAFHGLAGEFVRLMEPVSEADPAGLLLSFLVGAGNLIGRGPHFWADGQRHGCNLDVLLLGATFQGKKDTAAARAIQAISPADPDWSGIPGPDGHKRGRSCILRGTPSSGEGIVWEIRDPIQKKGKHGEDDPGIPDKRLLVVATEFACSFRAMERQGNTLGGILRQAWDGVTLHPVVSGRTNRVVSATDPHVSLLAGIVAEEAARYISATEAAGGTLNRFLVVAVRRSKCLPHGGDPSDNELQALARRIEAAAVEARKWGTIRWDPAAARLWEEVYPGLTEEREGMFGKVTARAAPQVRRIAMINALLALSGIILEVHLRAALAVWRYAEDSARYLFGDALGDPVADTILRALRANPEGLTRTDILKGLFSGHDRGIDRALALLMERGLARSERRGETGGRPEERWFATGGAA